MGAYGSVLRQTQCRKLPWLISGPPCAAQLSTVAELDIMALVCEVINEHEFDMHSLIIPVEHFNVTLVACSGKSQVEHHALMLISLVCA